MANIVQVTLDGRVRENYKINLRHYGDAPTEADVIDHAKQNMKEDGYSDAEISRAKFQVGTE